MVKGLWIWPVWNIVPVCQSPSFVSYTLDKRVWGFILVYLNSLQCPVERRSVRAWMGALLSASLQAPHSASGFWKLWSMRPHAATIDCPRHPYFTYKHAAKIVQWHYFNIPLSQQRSTKRTVWLSDSRRIGYCQVTSCALESWTTRLMREVTFMCMKQQVYFNPFTFCLLFH